MEPPVYLFGYLHDLLFLQGFRHLNQFRGMPSHDGLVHVTGIREAHDDVPACLLGKHLEGFGLLYLLCHLQRVVPVGYSQQQSVLIAFQIPYLQIAGTRHQRAVVIVHGVAQCIVVAVDLSTGLQEFHLVCESPFREDADSLFVGGLRATEGHVKVYNLLHPRLYLCHIVVCHFVF